MKEYIMLLDSIKNDQLQARKNKNEISTALLTTLYSEAVNIGKNAGNRTSTDDEVIAVIRKFIKAANENKEIYTKANNTKQVSIIETELNILNSYLPQSISEADIIALCVSVTQDKTKSPALMGGIMKELKAKYGSQLDTAVASQLVKNFLAN